MCMEAVRKGIGWGMKTEQIPIEKKVYGQKLEPAEVGYVSGWRD